MKKPQHRFIIGRKRQGLDDIFRETEVILDLPPEESDSETIILRGPKDKIGDAVGAGLNIQYYNLCLCDYVCLSLSKSQQYYCNRARI